MAVRNDISVDWTKSPRIISIAAPATEVTVQDLHDTLRDIEDEPDAIQFGSKSATGSIIETAGKEPLGGGVTVGLTATLRNARVAFEARQTIRTSGTITTADTSGRLVVDSSATFITDGVSIGDWVVNMADGSGATVTTVVSETTLITDILDGGTDNQFEVGDSYRIWPVIQVAVSGGNLVAVDDDGNEIDPVLPTFGTQVVATRSSSATLQELKDIQYASFNGGITVDLTSPYSGTFYPRGTPREPVNNFDDALNIAVSRGFTTLYVTGNATVPSGDYRNYNFVGSGVTESTISIDSAAMVDGASFTQCTLMGTLDGDVFIDDCVVDDLTFVDGTIQNSTLTGTIVLSGSKDATFVSCRDGAPGTDLPHIDMNGTGSALNIKEWSGGVLIRNKTGPEPVVVDLISGHVTIDSDVTAGTLTIRGIGTIEDNSGPGAVVDSGALLNRKDLYRQIVRAVYIDTSSTYSGSTEGIGLHDKPVNNLTDAKFIAARDGYTTFVVTGTLTLTEACDDLEFVGTSVIRSQINLNGNSVNNTTFSTITVSGDAAGSTVDISDGKVSGLSNFSGVVRGCEIAGSLTPSAGSQTIFVDCFGSLEPSSNSSYFSQGSNSTAVFRNWSGPLTLNNVVAGDTVAVDADPGNVVVSASCTGGSITVRGSFVLQDNSAGAVVAREGLDSATLEFLRKASDNRLEVDIDAQELVLYDDDGVTVIRRWPLETDGGEPIKTSDGVQTRRLPSIV